MTNFEFKKEYLDLVSNIKTDEYYFINDVIAFCILLML